MRSKVNSITFRLSDDELSFIEQAASENGLTLSGFIRWVIAQYKKTKGAI